MNSKHLTITELLHKTVLSKIAQHRKLLIAYSGGIDSTVLLHTLVMLREHVLPDLTLQAIYIHHGISQNADSWAEHCLQQCANWQVPCVVERVTLALEQGNIEAQAREARYNAMSQHLNVNAVLCTAQHLDDQSETFFLALKRGSGPAGLSAMPEISQLNDIKLLRPLLTITRQQIEQYAADYQLSWIEDESNQDDHYDRNFLRLKVLPELNQRWPHFNQMVVRSAELCQEQQQLLDELLSETFKQLIDEQQRLLIQPLMSCSAVKRNALLRMWFKLQQVNMPSRKQLELIWQTVILAREDSNPQFVLGDQQIRRYQGQLYLLPQYQDLQSVKIAWDLQNPLRLPDNLGTLSIVTTTQASGCRLPLANEVVTVHFQTQGVFNIVGRKGSRPLKKLWQELAIPPWMRNRIPLVFYNETLITAVGIFVTQQGQGSQVNYLLSDVNF